ncbi:MAG: oligosaccharide flippase family protein [Rhodoferax sp.]|nr:oligosaccharide flippase family protein [Rhodoferax sp.]
MRLSHIGWNLAGLSLPLLVAAVTVPHLIAKLGNERFGLLALAWGLIGYAGALDLGIGRALTQMVARLRGDGNVSVIPDALATARRITLIAGLVGGVAITLVAFVGVSAWIGAKATSPAEIRNAMLLLAIALPAQAMSATFRGLNEAYLNFKGISLVRVGLGIVNFGGPYLVTLYTTQLPWLVATLVVSRLLALMIYRRLAYMCFDEQPGIQRKGIYSPPIARSLFSFGGWITVSSVVGPILTQADRFMVASVLSAAMVTIYVLPYEVVVQSLILVGAVSSVIFPTLSRLMHEQPDRWQAYFRRWLLAVAAMMLVVCALLALLLPMLLPLWIKTNLQPESIVVGQILCLGVFANAIGTMYYALLHAKGRSDLTAKLHLIELPIFIGALVILLNQYGIEGAAWAWVGRAVFDAIFLKILSRS